MCALGQFLKRAESCSKLIYSPDPRPVPLTQLRGDTLRRGGWGGVKLVLLKMIGRLSFSFAEVSTYLHQSPCFPRSASQFEQFQIHAKCSDE